jgi:L-cysteine desulfidase
MGVVESTDPYEVMVLEACNRIMVYNMKVYNHNHNYLLEVVD